MNPSLHILLDIEGLGLRSGSAVVQLGAVAFSIETGKTGEAFHRYIRPCPALTVDLDTIKWHEEKNTWPPAADVEVHDLGKSMVDFMVWISDLGEPVSFWSWGSTYDFPLLEAAHLVCGEEQPWEYWQASCARTVWRLAFPDIKHDPRPHHALEDAIAAVADLMKAVNHFRATAGPTIHPFNFYRAGLRDLLSAAALCILARVGPSGLSTPEISAALDNANMGHALRRLVVAGLVTPPSRDGKQGRPNRYVITDAGLRVQTIADPSVQSSHQLTLPTA